MRRALPTLATLAVITLFLLPLAGYAAGLFRGAATGENRTLAAWPEWLGVLDAKVYFEDADAHLSDRFGGRMPLIRLSRSVKDNLGEDAPLVVRGVEPWLFLGENAYRDEFEGVGDWTDARVERWIADLLAARDVFADRGIPMAVTIAPDKARIYPEYLPEDWSAGTRRFKSRLLSDPKLAGVAFDPEPGMLARKGAGEAVFYARNTHWSPSGSYPVIAPMLAILDPQGQRPRAQPGVPQPSTPEGLQDLEVMQAQTETREPAQLMRPKPDLSNYRVQMVDADGDGTPDRGALHTKIVTADGPPAAQGTLVIVGDSFADFMMELFLPHYARVVKIHHGAGEYDVGTDEVLSYDPDAVLVMIVERSAHRKDHPIVAGPTVSRTD